MHRANALITLSGLRDRRLDVLIGLNPGPVPGKRSLSLEVTPGEGAGAAGAEGNLAAVSLSSPAPAWRQHSSHGSIAPGTGSGSAPPSIMPRIISTVPSGTMTMASARYSTAP